MMMWNPLLLLLLFLVLQLAESLTPHHKIASRWLKQRGKALGVSADSNSITSSAELTITVPPYYKGGNETLKYPSPLHHIYVESVMSSDEASKALQLAQEYAEQTGRWEQPDFERHSTYATCDFAVEDCETLASYLEDIGFHERMWDVLHERYGIDHEDMTYLDFFCAHYRAKEDHNEDAMDHLEEHRDGSILSFSVTLTPPDRFEGGGTSFAALVSEDNPNGVIKVSEAGHAVLHSGKLLHGGHMVTKGNRTVLVGFVDVADWCVQEGVLGEASKQFGRLDVANYHSKRQKQKISDDQKFWKPSNEPFLTSPSVLRPKVMTPMPSNQVRTDPEFQRVRRLETEDILLRSLLLDEKQSSPNLFFKEQGIQELTGDVFDGDITIL